MKCSRLDISYLTEISTFESFKKVKLNTRFIRSKIFFSILFSISCIGFEILGQNENSNWLLGHNLWIKFNSIPATVTSSPKSFECFEGSSAISNKGGQLLMYTNGQTIYNRNGDPMLNGTGLEGKSSAANCLIAKLPGCEERFYYVFTVGSHEENDILKYSVVDMSLNSGLGGVIAGRKNLHLSAKNASEKLTYAIHENGQDIWVLSHSATGDEFWSYLLTPAGLSPVIISKSGFSFSTAFQSAGNMCVSPDKKKIGITYHDYNSSGISSNFQILSFNSRTGKIGDVLYECLASPWSVIYDLAFSPNSRFVYVTTMHSWLAQNNIVHQYDLSNQNFCNSATSFLGNTCITPGIELAPDNKIYFAQTDMDYKGQSYLGIINNPDLKGIACDLKQVGLNLPNNTTSLVNLCQAAATHKDIELNIDTLFCASGPVSFNGVRIINDTSFKVLKKGLTGACDTSFKINAKLSKPYQINTIFDICEGDSVKIGNKYFKTDTQFVSLITKPGSCDTILNFSLKTNQHVITNKAYMICQGQSIRLNNLFIDKDTSFQYTSKGICDTVFNVKVSMSPFIEVIKSVEVCRGDSVKILSKWYKENMNDTLYLKHNISSVNDCDSIVYIQVLPSKVSILSGLDKVIVSQGSTYFPRMDLTFNNLPDLILHWSITTPANRLSCTTCDDPSVTAIQNDTIKLTIKDSKGCQESKFIQLAIKNCNNIYIPNVFTPNGDNINDRFYPSSDDCIKEINLLEIYDRWGDIVFKNEHFQANDPGAGWDGRFRNKPLDPAVFVYRMVAESNFGTLELYKGDITLIR
jgi:gliding motility-associated-like protein